MENKVYESLIFRLGQGMTKEEYKLHLLVLSPKALEAAKRAGEKVNPDTASTVSPTFIRFLRALARKKGHKV